MLSLNDNKSRTYLTCWTVVPGRKKIPWVTSFNLSRFRLFVTMVLCSVFDMSRICRGKRDGKLATSRPRARRILTTFLRFQSATNLVRLRGNFLKRVAFRTSKDSKTGYTLIRSPAREAGAATLRTDEGLWNYAPRADRLIRIPTGLLSESWMGSHFTNDDLMRETSYLDDYDAELSSEDRDGVTYLKATLIPKPDAPVVYSELVFLITPDEWVPVRSEYYDDGELIRVWAFDEIQTIAGKRIPMRMTILPVDEPEERTVVEYLELELDVPVDDQLFTRQGLRRAARG